MQEKPPADLVRTTLGVLFLGGLILSAFWILRPFIGATIWATMLVVSTWPVMKWLSLLKFQAPPAMRFSSLSRLMAFHYT